jgi:hypothetical protein
MTELSYYSFHNVLYSKSKEKDERQRRGRMSGADLPAWRLRDVGWSGRSGQLSFFTWALSYSFSLFLSGAAAF